MLPRRWLQLTSMSPNRSRSLETLDEETRCKGDCNPLRQGEWLDCEVGCRGHRNFKSIDWSNGPEEYLHTVHCDENEQHHFPREAGGKADEGKCKSGEDLSCESLCGGCCIILRLSLPESEVGTIWQPLRLLRRALDGIMVMDKFSLSYLTSCT